jgi:hypothetical protein
VRWRAWESLDEATEGLSPLVRQDIWRSLAALKAEDCRWSWSTRTWKR